MTSRAAHPHPTHLEALIVVDVQRAFVRGDGALPEAARLVDRTAELIARAREAGALVVHVQNDGPAGADDEPHTAGWELHHPVEAGRGDVVIRKTHDDAFQETSLEGLLTSSGVRSLAVCGLMSEMCVQATARTAVALGHRVVLPYDAHATYDIPAEPGISAVVPAAMVSRVAAWPLSRDADVTARTADVRFTAPAATGS
ncbi:MULTISPECIES: isochorismatase family protein [Streptomyces]|uniref:Isochorismatase family protein n=1 Tax=Streptomyces glycanivorans TaxID=3033808 RepID=A0ABY9JEI4_9ACTN|nr:MULTISPECIES: isochorismatase family protein [unclassified Streptomyces]WSQ79628.1 isochorismatase family protein [Streptomyces sp. NBC_01213]TXS15474.1 isochorismatase family protein [Streptomyces sp. wa22]WLQ66186.1 isochorismatase family protein [Streptomyces sp. Alt3]WSQ87008.1 isochorismatase family protein [Streptomyces sp. NBC_01212]WSR06973.1 isochorismatase family protein [Streptomyces sp. NBC_01208]